MTRDERAGWLWKALLAAEGKGRVVVDIKKKTESRMIVSKSIMSEKKKEGDSNGNGCRDNRIACGSNV